MFFSIALDVLIAVYVLSRQRRIRPVPRVLSLRMPVFFGILGLADMLSYTDNHHVGGSAYAWVFGTLTVGAVALGAVRALTVRLWSAQGWVLRQGTTLTLALWAVSLALHFVGSVAAQHANAGNLEASSFLLYLGVTYGVQNYVVHRRAVPLWEALGPDAGPRLHISFLRGPGGPGGMGAPGGAGGPGGGLGGFFGGFGPAPGAGAWTPPARRGGSHESVIDVDEVPDDEGPPALR
jgi:hypothetical protein